MIIFILIYFLNSKFDFFYKIKYLFLEFVVLLEFFFLVLYKG